MSSGWTPTNFVVDGEFATTEDLVSAADTLRGESGAPVVVVTFSSRWCFSSLTLMRSDDPAWSTEAVRDLEEGINAGLRDSNDKCEFVASRVRAAFERVGLTAETAAFGEGLDRAGQLAVVVGHGGEIEDVNRRDLEQIAACALASRPAVFSLNTSLELAVLSEVRQAKERARAGPPSLVDAARSEPVEALVRFASELLRTSVALAFEADKENPHRFRHMDLKTYVPGGRDVAAEWVPPLVVLSDEPTIPLPPELGGSKFKDLGPLISHCVSSKKRPRMLVASIADEFHVLGVPYGFDNVRRRAIGVLCLAWPIEEARRLGSYELAVSRMIAGHLARAYDSRHSDDTVQLVTSQLSFISELPKLAGRTDLVGCDSVLPSRRDVGLIAEPIVQILRGLINLSGAMSATCRLVTGADGPAMSRHLARVHCEGDACATDSPSRIPVADSSSSANAWVATTGRALYLRNIEKDDANGNCTSDDLSAYEGIDAVSIYRDGVACELCVPIFAESRLVGTINLESDRPDGFDSVAETVAEYAQLIGIALLESRRRIGVDTVTEIEGFLDYRHRLDGDLRELASTISNATAFSEESQLEYTTAIDGLRELVYMRRIPDADQLGEAPTVGQAIRSAMTSIEWATFNVPLEELSVEPWSEDIEGICDTGIEKDAARALAFAVAQALHNVRAHGGSGDELAKRRYSAMFRFAEMTIGGTKSVYVAVSSTCALNKFDELDHHRVFREPIEREERVSVGAFLAGETLRRCGGSAFLRVTPSDEHDHIVDAEFGVPVAQK